MRVLVVCLGNICRSPIGQAMLAAAAPHWQVESAGTGGWHAGDPPDIRMQRAAAARGIDLSGQRARQVVAADFTRFDLVLAMDTQNAADLEALRPAGNATPLRRFADRDVPDPYYTNDFEGCIDLVTTAAQLIVNDSSSLPDG